jgi:hypothetical protein
VLTLTEVKSRRSLSTFAGPFHEQRWPGIRSSIAAVFTPLRRPSGLTGTLLNVALLVAACEECGECDE